MKIYFFMLIKAMAMSDINLNIYSKIIHLPMCGYEGPSSKINSLSGNAKLLPPQSLQLSHTIGDSSYRNSIIKNTDDETDHKNSDSTEDVNEELTDVTSDERENSYEKDTGTEKDQIDLGIGAKELDRLYILTYMSPETTVSNGDGHGGDTNAFTDIDIGKTTKTAFLLPSKTSRTTSLKTKASKGTPEPTETIFDRKRRDSIAIPSRGSKEASETIPCSCLITTAYNFSVYIFHVHGSRPNKTRLVIDADNSNLRNKPLDVANFWNSAYTIGPEWWQSQKIAKVRFTIDEQVKPRLPYMVMLGVSGGSDLDIQCRSKSNILGDIRGLHSQPHSIRSTTETTSSSTEIPVTPKKEAITDQTISITNPWFIGAITVLAVALIFMITGLTLWKRSHANFRKANKNNQNNLISTHGYSKNDELVYEEIPVGNRNRSGSKTKLGTTSLSVRGQHSPVLNHHDRKKDSLDRRVILTTVPHSPANTNDNHAMRRNTLPKSNDAVYEELPEYMECESVPPTKPFLDRESLMIQRSQSTPIHYCIGSDCKEESEERGENRKQKSSLSYSEDRSARININYGELLLNKDEYTQKSVPAREAVEPPFRSGCENGGQGDESGASSSESHWDDDTNNDNNDHDDQCVCGANDANNTYVDIDCQHCHSGTHKKATNTLQHDIKVTRNIPRHDDPNQTVPEMKARVLYSQEHGEEVIIFDKIVYQSSSALQTSY